MLIGAAQKQTLINRDEVISVIYVTISMEMVQSIARKQRIEHATGENDVQRQIYCLWHAS